MKKLFWILVVLSLVGSAVLLWLIKTMPQQSTLADSAHSSEQHAVDEHHGHDHAEGEHPADEGAPEDHSEHGDAVQEEKKADGEAHHDAGEEKSDIAHHESPVVVSDDSVSKVKMVLKTEPSDADVYVDREYYGKSPVEIPLLSQSRELRVEKEGHKSIQEILPPAAKANSGDLHWNLSLDKSISSETIPLLSGKQGPAFIQVRSLPISDFQAGNYGVNTTNLEGLIGCKVEIRGKGVWVRVLRGPYLKSFAEKMLKSSRETYASDAFVVGGQECLP
ncbi:PEGA domain-containing protein [bacterium]|nr:PEGA domain-containing protein [bacterium]